VRSGHTVESNLDNKVVLKTLKGNAYNVPTGFEFFAHRERWIWVSANDPISKQHVKPRKTRWRDTRRKGLRHNPVAFCYWYVVQVTVDHIGRESRQRLTQLERKVDWLSVRRQ
jgi:hypothetical protein